MWIDIKAAPARRTHIYIVEHKNTDQVEQLLCCDLPMALFGVLPMVPLVILPTVPLVAIGSQWCHWLTNGTNGTNWRANGTIGITIGTNGITNGTIVRTLNDIGIPLVPLVEP